jgi:PAS domain S-box-containing protein
MVRRWEKEQTQAEFNRRADNYMVILKGGIARTKGVLRSLAAFNASRGDVDEQSFQEYLQEFRSFSTCSLSCHVETKLLGWVPRIMERERAAYERIVHESGYENFQISEYVPGGTFKRAGIRAEYFVILNVEPFDQNSDLLGLDLYTNETFQRAINKAIDSGKTTSTGWLLFGDESARKFEYMLFLPLYRNNQHYNNVSDRRENIIGFAVGLFIVNKLAENSFEKLMMGGLDVHIYDKESYGKDKRLVYRSRGNREGAHPDYESDEEIKKGFYVTRSLDISGRIWEVVFHLSHGAGSIHSNWQSNGFLAIGLILTSILVTYLFINAGESVFIENLINERTAELADTNKKLESEITRHKLTGEALEESEENYRNIYNNAQVGLFRVKINDGEVINANTKFARMFGYGSQQEAVAEFSFFEHYADREDYIKMINDLQETGEVVNLEVPLLKKDGTRFWVRFWARIYLEKCYIEGVATDITEEKIVEEDNKKLQSQLLQSQKMESIGRLAGGIAHDFNNMLTGIMGYTELALSELDENHPVYRKLKIIDSSSQKASALTRQLLAFSRKQILDMRTVNLNVIVQNMIKLFERLIGDDIQLKLKTKRKVMNIKADPVQVEQILMNLVVNGRDAMPGGGYLTIETKDVKLSKKYVKEHKGLKPGSYVRLTVSDTGTGMEEDVMDKVFEPFFTTKPTGKGTGLGLSTVFGIIKQHNGHISIHSEMESGTTFRVFFPAESGSVAAKEDELEITVEKGTERILVVDDEHFVCDFIKDTLEPLGYKILTASNSDDAMKLSYKEKEPIDLLLTDIIMPGVDGRELARAMKKSRPEMKVIFMSGYTDDKIVSKGILKAGVDFLQKPLEPRRIAKRVRDILDQKTLNV